MPAHKEGWYDRLAGWEADLLILDLEDGVPEALKDAARQTLLGEKERTAAFREKEFFVRINSVRTPHFPEDIRVVLRLLPLLDGIVLPKVEEAGDILRLDEAVRDTSLEIVPIIELLKGEYNVVGILQASPRVRCVHFAETGDYGLEFDLFERHFDAMRDPIATHFAINILKAARMTGKEVVDGAYLDIRDLKGLKERCAWAVEMGFDGKVALHPDQAAVINRAMSPDPAVMERAAEVVRVYERSLASSSFVAHKGSFIIPPKYEAAKRLLKRHGREK